MMKLNNMTSKFKKKHLLNTDNLKYYSILLLDLNFLQNLSVFLSNILVSKGKFKNSQHSFIMPLFAVLNIFVNK